MATFTTMLIAGEWELIQANVLKNRDGFDKEMFNLLHNSFDSTKYKSASIILPVYVTTSERHRLHKYTINGYIEPVSSGNGSSRSMTINLSNEYIKDIYEDYNVIVIPTTIQLSELELYKIKLREAFKIFTETYL